jgi:drug/metabolite transporter (DMT)-like permease
VRRLAWSTTVVTGAMAAVSVAFAFADDGTRLPPGEGATVSAPAQLMFGVMVVAFAALGALLAVAAWQGTATQIGHGAAWWLSLLYLTVFGSVVAFFVYFKLAHRVGPARAAMTGVMIPPIALVVSAALEGWQPSLLSWSGVLLCLGSVYAATRPTA